MSDLTPPADLQVYVNCMEKIRDRINVVEWAAGSARVFRLDHFVLTETVFLQFRKVLELIAYSSLTANKEKYAEAHANFHMHWRAVDMLKVIEKINPDFYPVPVMPPEEMPDGIKHLRFVTGDFVNRDEFAFLYDACGDILHMRNPFSEKDPVVQVRHGVGVWVAKIKLLLARHLVHLVDAKKKWVITIPPVGPVQIAEGIATD